MQEADQANIPPPEESKRELPSTPVPKKHRGTFWLAFIAFLFALASLIAHGFFLQHYQLSTAQLLQRSQQLSENLRPSINQLTAQVANQDKVIQGIVTHLQHDQRRVALLPAEEARYLLELAQYRLSFEGNTELAASLITDADQKLQGMNDPALAEVRKELAANLVALNALPKVDVAGLVARLEAISDQVAVLSLLPAQKAIPLKTNVSTKPTLQERIMEIIHGLRGVVTVRRLATPLQPMVAPEQQIYLVEQIRLQLMQAEWAVLHQHATLYQNALEHAKQNLSRLNANNAQSNQLIQLISTLEQIQIKPQLPSLSNALTTVNNYINSNQQNNTSLEKTPMPETAPVTPGALKALPL